VISRIGRKDSFDQLKGDWEAWNEIMPPEGSRPMRYDTPGSARGRSLRPHQPTAPGSTE
jgi:hypothetical protein